jgi:hypothetical protein
MKIHEIPYVPRETPVDTKQEHKGTFEEELRKQMRGQVVTNVHRGRHKEHVFYACRHK